MSTPSDSAAFVREAQHQLNGLRRFNRWMFDVLDAYLGQNVLEIGAGVGNFTAYAHARASYIASDSDDYCCRQLEKRFSGQPHVRVARMDLSAGADFDAVAGSVDTVLCLNVLEHVEDDALGLRHMRRALKDGGRLVLLVPQGPWLYGTIDALAGHKRRYRRADLGRLLLEQGFELEAMLDFNRAGTPGWLLNGRVLRARSFSPFQLKAFDALVWLFRGLDGLLPWPGQSVIAIAKKRAGS
jgi:SAM-dependent methyltransferase